MTLLFFTYLLAIFLFVFSYYLDSRAEKANSIFTGMTMNAAFVSLAVAVSSTLLYLGNNTMGGLAFLVALVCIALFSLSLLRFCFAIPYNLKSKAITVLSVILGSVGAYIILAGKIALKWDEKYGFDISSNTLFGSVMALDAFSAIFLFALPALAIVVTLVRAVTLQSRIYRQRLLFVVVSICAGLAVAYVLYRLSWRFFWIFPLTPYGIAVMIVLIFQSVSQTTLVDRSHVAANLINFTVLNVSFCAVAALASAIVIELIPYPAVTAISLVIIAVFLLYLRGKVGERLGRYIRVGTEYEADLERELDAIDYTAGGEGVINRTVSLLEQYVECSSVDILVSDDKGKLVTVYAKDGAKHEIPLANNKAIDMLVGNNDSIVLKTQAITKHVYADVKGDLLKIFDTCHADAMILLREGHLVVGMMLLGAKKRGSDYSEYDYTVLAKLYSNFFLVMYYLKNIANESVVLTVDREIEFSGQIITSIQENIDRIHHEKVDVDFITKSARKLGGDFIDFIKLGEDKYLFVMGDVSGKGLNASMSMVILKSVLRTFLSETGDFKKLVVKVNLFIKNQLPKGTFFAGVFGLMDFSTNTLFYINCGVPAMFLYTASYNNAIEIQGDGKVLGFVRDIGKYLKVKKIVLNPQDILLLTTDGLVDSTNLRGERFGKDRVQRMLMDNRSYPAERMAKFLCDSLGDFVSRELEDDISVLVFKYLSR